MIKFLTLKWTWLKNPDNRKLLYAYMRYGVAPAAIAAGVISPDEADKWLLIVSSLFLFGSSTIASRHVNNKEVANEQPNP
jgi:hypothetical protein